MNVQYKLAQIFISLTARLFFRWKVIGAENIPEEGALIASNHLSSYDPPLIGSAIRREMFYFAKVELFKNSLLSRFLRSVNAYPVRRGEADREAWKTSKKLLQSGKLLLFFPEGGRSQDGQLRAAKPGMARLAYTAGVPIIPAAVTCSHRLRDVFLRRCKLRIGFSRPVSLSEFRNEPTRETMLKRMTERVMNEISRLQIEVQQV